MGNQPRRLRAQVAEEDVGTWLAFDSDEADLVADDHNQSSDIFLRNLGAETTGLISQRLASRPSRTVFGGSIAGPNAVSADGRFVVFTSLDRRLAGADTNGGLDVFVRDLAVGTNWPVSVDASGAVMGNGASRDAVISADGRYVVFVSSATNLTTDTTNYFSGVFRRDLAQGTTIRIAGDPFGNNTFVPPSVSGDGQRVAFSYAASGDVFVQDVATSSNLLASANFSGTAGGNGASTRPQLRRDGRWGMFQSRATNLTTNQVSSANDNLFARDLTTGETLLLNVNANGTTFSGDASDVSISASGRTLVYSLAQNVNGTLTTYVCVYDLLARTNAIVCTNCKQPTSSGDGRRVAFISTTSRQVMLKDLQTGVTIRLSTSVGAREQIVSAPTPLSAPIVSSQPAVAMDGGLRLFPPRVGR